MIHKISGRYIKDNEFICDYQSFISHCVDGSEILYVRTHIYNINDKLGYMYVMFRNDNIVDTMFVPKKMKFEELLAKCEKCNLLSYDVRVDVYWER